MKLKNKQKIHSLLEDDQLGEVVNELKKQLKNSAFYPELLGLSAQLSKINADKIARVLSYEQETLAVNNLRRSLGLFIEKVQNDDEVIPPPPPPDGGSSWLWWVVGLPVFIGGLWWLFFRDAPIQSNIRICTSNVVGNLNWCDNDMPRMALGETLRGLVATAVFEGQSDVDPLITGTLLKTNTGEIFPTQRIQLTMSEGGVGYAGFLTPASGVFWDPGMYTLQLQYNGEPAGEKNFELFTTNTFNQ